MREYPRKRQRRGFWHSSLPQNTRSSTDFSPPRIFLLLRPPPRRPRSPNLPKKTQSQNPSPSGLASRCRDRAAGSFPHSKKRRSRAIRGIATAIPLPVDSLWPGWICARLQSCSGTGRFRWLCVIPISPPSTRLRPWIGWSPFRNGRDTRTDTGAFLVKEGPTALPASHWI